MGDLNGAGVVVGLIAWFACIYAMAEQTYCMRFNSCDTGDLVLMAVIGIGFIAPAWIAAVIASALFAK